MPRPLEGVVVLDLSRLLPGPFCTQLLSNLGADVIKVEDPDRGDYLRAVPPTIGDTSYPFVMVNRGKQSIAIDLREEDGQRVLYRLCKKADVFIEQFRPSAVKRLKIDYAQIRQANPRIIYCSFGGYGRTGPYSDKPGHDLNFEALSGILSVTSARSTGQPTIPPIPVSDLASAFMAALTIVASLHRRARFGEGEFLEVSIFDVSVSLMVLPLAQYLATGEVPMPGETIVTGMFPFYNLYRTKDSRWLSVACVEPHFWRRLCEVTGLRDHVDEQFAGGERAKEITAHLASAFRLRPLADWMAVFDQEELPITPVQRLDEVVRDPHVVARKLLPEVRTRAGRRKVIAHAAKHYAGPAATPARVPARGEDTEAILRWAGFTAKEIKTLIATDVVATGP